MNSIQELILKPCPFCGGKALLIKESKLFTKRLNKTVQYSRIVCQNNSPANTNDRCLCKTVAAPTEEVIAHWNKRK